MRTKNFQQAVAECENNRIPLMAWPEDKGKYTWDAYPRIDTAECCADFDLIGNIWTNLNNVNQDVQAGNLYAVIQEDYASGACWVGIWKPRERHGSPNCNCDALISRIEQFAVQLKDADDTIDELQARIDELEELELEQIYAAEGGCS